MNGLLRLTLLAAVTAVLTLAPTTLQAQNQNRQNRQRGNFDPAQMQQRMMERYREQFDVKNDDEWKVLEPRIQKVMDARREVGGGGFAMMGRMGGRGGRNASSGAEANANGGQGGGRRGGGRQLSPAAQDLQRAIEAKAPTEEIKTKLAKYREDRKQKEENLTKAQEDLRKVLNARQEATAVLMGLLN